MKYYLLFPLLFIASFGFGQECNLPVNEAGNYELVEVVKLEQYSKDDIYDQALLSLSDYVDNPNELTKFRDKETGSFVTELQVMVKSYVVVPSYFFFNLTVEIKDGRYRTTVHYVDNKLFITEESSCHCGNDIANDLCDPSGCLVMKKSWNKLRCEAVESLENTLLDYNKALASNLSKQDW